MKKSICIIGIVLTLTLGLASWFISMGIVRATARAFAEPNPYKWEWVYVSTSPRAYSYHQRSDCKYLRRTNHIISLVSVYDADDAGRTPCSYCLENSRRHQYDNTVWYVVFPVFLVLMGIVAFVENVVRRRKSKNNKDFGNIAYPERAIKAQISFFERHKGDRKDWLFLLSLINEDINNIYKCSQDGNVIDKQTANRALELTEILSQSGYLGAATAEELNKLKEFVDYDSDDAIVRKIICTLTDSKEQILFSVSMKYINESHKVLNGMMLSKEKESAIHQAHIDDVNRTVRKLVGGK